MAAGIRTRHSSKCASRNGKRCNCTPSYEAWVYSKRDDKKIRKTFKSLAEAKGWRGDAEGAVRKRTLRAPSKVTLTEAADEWLEGAEAGTIRTRSGDAYKPSAIRGYEAALRLRVLPELGGARVSDVSRVDLQEFIEGLKAKGLNASTVQTTLMPVRAIYRRASPRGRSRSTRPRRSRSRRSAGSAIGSHHHPRPRACSPRCPSATVRCGQRRCTQGSAAASSWRFAGRTSTWPLGSFASSARGT
jgi:hypothetical protein